MTEPDRIVQLVMRCDQLERENADLRRQVAELRSAVDALLQPSRSELLSANLTEAARRRTSGL